MHLALPVCTTFAVEGEASYDNYITILGSNVPLEKVKIKCFFLLAY